MKNSSESDLEAYHRYMTQVAILMGADSTKADIDMQQVLEFESKLANVRLGPPSFIDILRFFVFKASLPETERQDTSAIYRRFKLKELNSKVPQIRWLDYLKACFPDVNITMEEPVVSYAISYFVEMGKLVAETDKRFLLIQIAY